MTPMNFVIPFSLFYTKLKACQCRGLYISHEQASNTQMSKTKPDIIKSKNVQQHYNAYKNNFKQLNEL